MRSFLSVLLIGGLLSGTASATDPAPAPAPAASTPIPSTYAAIVAELRTQATGIDAAISKGNVADMRAGAKRVVDLATAVAGKVDSLPADARASATAEATRVKAKANEILAAADKNDMPSAKTAVAAMKTDIEALAKHLPK